MWLCSRNVTLWVFYLEFMDHRGHLRDALDSEERVSSIVMRACIFLKCNKKSSALRRDNPQKINWKITIKGPWYCLISPWRGWVLKNTTFKSIHNVEERSTWDYWRAEPTYSLGRVFWQQVSLLFLFGTSKGQRSMKFSLMQLSRWSYTKKWNFDGVANKCLLAPVFAILVCFSSHSILHLLI